MRDEKGKPEGRVSISLEGPKPTSMSGGVSGHVTIPISSATKINMFGSVPVIQGKPAPSAGTFGASISFTKRF